MKAGLCHTETNFYFCETALLAAIRPKVKTSAVAFPPRRLEPWMPPVTSPAAKSPGIGLAVLIQNLSVRRNHQTAHRMVDGRSARCRIERRFNNLSVKQLAAELRIVFGFDHLVEFRNSRFQFVSRHTKLFCQICKCIGFINAADLDESFNVFIEAVERLNNGRVVDVVADRVRLLLNGGNEFISSGVFFNEALTVLIDVNDIIKTAHLAGAALKSAGTRCGKRIDLNIIHAGCICAVFGRDDNAVAGLRPADWWRPYQV